MSSSTPWRCDVVGTDYCIRQFTTIPVVTVAVQFLLYGSYAILYGICIFFLTKRKRQRYIIHCLAISALFVLATIGLVTNTMNAAAYAELMFHESAPTNSIEAGKNSEERLVKRIGATGAAAVISYIIANIIGDAIMIWRCYCIWGSRIKVIIIPTILCLGSNALAIVDTVKANPLHPVLGGDKSLYTLSPPQILISFLFVTMFANALLTLMIAGRIFYITRKAIRLLGNHVRRTYRTIIAIVLESGMLYPFALILYGAVLLSMLVKGGDRDESNRNRLAADLIAQVMAYSIIQFVGIAPTLIVVRTGLGISVENVESTVATIRAELSDLGEITPEAHHTSRICFRNSVNITEPPDIEQELELEVPPPGKSIKSQRRTTSNCSLSEPGIT